MQKIECLTRRPELVEVLHEIFTAIRTELTLDHLDMSTLNSLAEEMGRTNALLLQQAADDLRAHGKTEVMGSDPEKISAEFQAVARDIHAALARRTMAATEQQSSIVALNTVDKPNTQADDVTMSATTDKDYIDSRLETIETRMDGRLAAIESSLDSKLASIDSKMDAKFAQFDAILHKSTAETVKWVAGIVLGLGVIGISLMTFLINNAVAKPPAASAPPIIITVPGMVPAPTQLAPPVAPKRP